MPVILIVDDDASVRSILTRTLENALYSVLEAKDGTDAVSEIRAHHADLVLMDIVMPGKGGIEAIMEIHSIQPELAIVIMSGKVPLETDAMNNLMKRYGAKAILPKPFTTQELLETVRSALEASA